jgi:hypothetical protein
MGFFSQVLTNRNLIKHDGRPLWSYNLSDFEFSQLHTELKQVRLCNLDARGVALYFAEWWKRKYNGGFPSKQDVFKSLSREDNAVLTADVLYENARRGAQMLGVKWIQKQNTLYFKTLLLQGGIPIKHISENKSHYQTFLLGLLELQPNTVEDIVLQPGLTSILPVSSRNETIYENCLSVVKSILNDEDTYNALLEGNSSLKEIQTALQVRKHQLSRKAKVCRPKIFWMMDVKDCAAEISLRMGFSNRYDACSLSEILNLSQPAEQRTYHLYLDERLICSFRKTLIGDYKTEWQNQKIFRWNSKQLAPQFYCVCNDEQWEISDLIPLQPMVNAPTLWTSFGDDKWRLVKGNAINSPNALLLLPTDWVHSNAQYEIINIDNHRLKRIQFEGGIVVTKSELVCKYFSNVESFDWIIKNEKPLWMRKADVAIVSRCLRLYVYNNEGSIVDKKDYKVSIRSSASNSLWQLSDSYSSLPVGLIDVKIERNGVIAYDTAYNIGDLKLDVIEQKLDFATLKWDSSHSFNIAIVESKKFSATSEGNNFHLQLNTEQLSIPDAILFKLKFRNSKELCFDIITPFSGIGLLDKDGTLLSEGTVLTIGDLHGIRIFTTNAGETIVKFWNKFRDQVKISKTIHFAHQPLINFKEELQRLFYLADVMLHYNLVMIEISNGKSKRSYCAKGFSHTINDVSTQFDRKIMMEGTNEQLQLFAVPLNCSPEDIQLLSMQIDAENYHNLPQDTTDGQFIVISDTSNGKQLQPRFINTDRTYKVEKSAGRIDGYHSNLLVAEIDEQPWKELITYYSICVLQKIPFSTFDQIRAISRSSRLAAKAFFALGVNQVDSDEFIQKQVPALEQDLGFCFHWIEKRDWEDAIQSVEKRIGSEYLSHLLALMAKYFQEANLDTLYKYILGQNIANVVRVNNQMINDYRAQLGERVLSELPEHTPHTTNEYNIPIANNHMIKLLLRSPISIAESIKGSVEKSIWEDSEFVSNLRRNIQYAHLVAPDLYNKVLCHCLSTK